ncbi:MAG: hypothetical protein ACI4DN_05200 [Lachnospiraceae bacterium]
MYTLLEQGTTNPAWTVNTSILAEINNSSDLSKTVLIACKSNFEVALLGESVSKEKPYHTLEKMKNNKDFCEKVKALLDALLDSEKEPPKNCICWQELSDIE